MINKVKKFILLDLIIMIVVFLGNSIDVLANEQNLYLAYTEIPDMHSGARFRITDGTGKDGKDNIVYCYNQEYNQPGLKADDEKYKTYYTKIESYLDSDDPYTEQYGKDKKKRIAAILVAGYPVDAYGLFDKCGISEDNARYITQLLIWSINEDLDGELVPQDGISYDMALYHNELLKISKKDNFEKGSLNLEGRLEFSKRGETWSTDRLATTGNTGFFKFEDLPKGMEVRDFNTDILLDGNIKVGQEFYIISDEEPSESLKLKITHQYKEVKLYFYKYHSGGVPSKPKPFQSLIRGDITDKFIKNELEIKVNGDFEKPNIPDIGGTTPPLPGDSGERPELPGDGGIGGITPPLPGDSGERPELPGDGGIGGITLPLPGDSGERPDLPGYGGIDGITTLLPVDSGERPNLAGDKRIGGTTPELLGVNPKTGDKGIQVYILLMTISTIGIFLIDKKNVP